MKILITGITGFVGSHLAEYYLKAEQRITVLEGQTNISDVKEELKLKDTQIKELLERMKIQELEMDILKNKLDIEKTKNAKK